MQGVLTLFSQSPAKTLRIQAAPGRWSLAQPPGVSTLLLLLGFSTVYTFISPKTRNFEEKKAREGARTVRAESKLRQDGAFRALELQQCPKVSKSSLTELASFETQRDSYGPKSWFPQTQAFLRGPLGIKRGLESTLGGGYLPSAYT